MQYIQMPFDRLHKDEFEPLESAAVDLEETREAQVITFEVGAALEDAKSQCWHEWMEEIQSLAWDYV
ncbi:hypothetical protein Tco_1065171 [Tanacetum coccineum]